MLDFFSELYDDIAASVNEMSASAAQKVDSFSSSIDSIKKDVDDIRAFVAAIMDALSGIYDFLGKETSVMVLSTFVFLTALGFIPFLFFDKKVRYFLGIMFGIFIGATYKYSALGISKFVFVMLFPLILEQVILFVINKTQALGAGLLKMLAGWAKALFVKAAGMILPKKKPDESSLKEK